MTHSVVSGILVYMSTNPKPVIANEGFTLDLLATFETVKVTTRQLKPGMMLVDEFGCPVDHCADIAVGIAQEVKDGRIRAVPGIHDWGDGGRLFFLPWSGDPDDFGQACAFHGSYDFSRFLAVLADDDGLFPWEGGAHVLQLWGLPEWEDTMTGRLPGGDDE